MRCTSLRSSAELGRMPWSKCATINSSFGFWRNKSSSTIESTPPETATTYLPGRTFSNILCLFYLIQTICSAPKEGAIVYKLFAFKNTHKETTIKKDKRIPADIVNLRGDDKRLTNWHKALASNPSGNCVEVGKGTGVYDGFVAVRDSKNPSGPALAFTPAEWTAFLQGAKDGNFDNK